ncbi:hypothetical protein [Paraburkholderia sp. CI3]|uniref:hypothetical protein n=1 Tax=Paraburkholderia sp. CI3 TaxID=2991060 RepID=UPI003D247349
MSTEDTTCTGTDVNLPGQPRLREVATQVAYQAAKQARDDGLTEQKPGDAKIEKLIAAKIWQPVYQDLRSASNVDGNVGSPDTQS